MDLSYLELEGQGRGTIMEVTRPLLLGQFYQVKWPITPNKSAGSVHIQSKQYINFLICILTLVFCSSAKRGLKYPCLQQQPPTPAEDKIISDKNVKSWVQVYMGLIGFHISEWSFSTKRKKLRKQFGNFLPIWPILCGNGLDWLCYLGDESQIGLHDFYFS